MIMRDVARRTSLRETRRIVPMFSSDDSWSRLESLNRVGP